MIFTSCEEIMDTTTGTVNVVNSTNSTIIVDINDGDGDWKGERTLSSGSSTKYSNCEEGSIDGVAKFLGYSTWYYSSTRTLVGGSSITITWYPTKKSGVIIKGLTADIGIESVGSEEKISSKE